MRPSFARTALLFLTLAAPLRAAEVDSVYRIDPPRETAIISMSALGIILPYSFSDQLINKRCPCDPNEVNRLDRGVIGNSSKTAATLSDVGSVLLVTTPVVLDWTQLGYGKPFVEDLVVYAETLAVNSAITSLVKVVAQRPIPRSYSGDPEAMNAASGYRSFYSGHVSTTMAALSAAAVTSNLRNHSGVWPWVIAACGGAAMAAGRILAGQHFYTDTFVGAAAGVAVGTAVPLLHRTERPSIRLESLRDGAALTFTWKLD